MFKGPMKTTFTHMYPKKHENNDSSNNINKDINYLNIEISDFNITTEMKDSIKEFNGIFEHE